jgi:3-polyprenyl-4-hydroxybenzoate decarboxylase
MASPEPGPSTPADSDGGTLRRLVVGISGATGIAYGMRVLELARKAGVETHLVVTSAGEQTRAYETQLSRRDLAAMADVSYRSADIAAAIASGWCGRYRRSRTATAITC